MFKLQFSRKLFYKITFSLFFFGLFNYAIFIYININYSLDGLKTNLEHNVIKMDSLIRSSSKILGLYSRSIARQQVSFDKLVTMLKEFEINNKVFYAIRFFDSKDEKIYSSSEYHSFGYTSERKKHIHKCKSSLSGKSINIHYVQKLMKNMVVICYKLSDNQGKYIGSICVDIIDLDKSLGDYNLIDIVSLTSDVLLIKKDYDYSLSDILKVFFRNKSLAMSSSNYDFILVSSINKNFIINLYTKIFMYLVVLIIFILVIYFIIFSELSKLNNSLYNMQITMNELSVDINSKRIKLDFEYFESCFKSLVECQKLFLVKEKEDHEYNVLIDNRKNIVKIIEDNYYSNFCKENLFYKKLKIIVNEIDKVIDFKEFIYNVVDYCCNYYDFLKICIKFSKEDLGKFFLKKDSLFEAIFHIFSAIIRIKINNYMDNIIELEIIFIDEKTIPTIIIKADLDYDILSNDDSSLYSGLLSISLLAKENNLILFVKNEDNIFTFKLEQVS